MDRQGMIMDGMAELGKRSTTNMHRIFNGIGSRLSNVRRRFITSHSALEVKPFDHRYALLGIWVSYTTVTLFSDVPLEGRRVSDSVFQPSPE